MDKYKFAIILKKEDENRFNDSMECLKKLSIPKGYNLELLVIDSNDKIAQTYNEIMQKTDAKYKIYLKDKACILNLNFLNELLEIFSDKSIAVVGIAGAKSIPISGLWWESQHSCGKYCTINDNKVREIVCSGQAKL